MACLRPPFGWFPRHHSADSNKAWLMLGCNGAVAFLIGTIAAIAVGFFARIVGLDRDRAFYPTVMIVIALLYVLFSAIGGSVQALTLELPSVLGFIVAAVVGFKGSLWVVAAALAAHGIYDFGHAFLFENPGVPSFWPAFCSAYDIVAAVFLGWLLWSEKIPARAA